MGALQGAQSSKYHITRPKADKSEGGRGSGLDGGKALSLLVKNSAPQAEVFHTSAGLPKDYLFYTTSASLPEVHQIVHTTSASLPNAQLIAYYLREPSGSSTYRILPPRGFPSTHSANKLLQGSREIFHWKNSKEIRTLFNHVYLMNYGFCG